ncbi:MAG: L-threonylcarbamoyladenylate synthase [Alphaproteobacteria bacterium]
MAIIQPYNPQSIKQACTILNGAGIIAFGTETVYGLGGDAGSDKAIASIFQMKARPQFNPLIVHIANLAMLDQLCDYDSKRLNPVLMQCWPGALSLVLPLKSNAKLSKLVTAGLDTVAVRMPNHQGALALMNAFGKPIAAPSANPSGKLSPTCADHVQAGLGEKLDLILDGGACHAGLESTIIDLTDPDSPHLLRLGTHSLKQLQQALGAKITLSHSMKIDDAGDAASPHPTSPHPTSPHPTSPHPTSPGQLLRHYAPSLPLRLDAAAPTSSEAWLGFGADFNANLSPAPYDLSPNQDYVEAAANLFKALHYLDQIEGVSGIAVTKFPKAQNEDQAILRLAILDRLERGSN